MAWESIIAIGITAVVTLLRVGWIATRPIPHDVQRAIMPGLQRIGHVLRGEVKVGGNAPYGIIWYAINLPLGRIVRFDGRMWMVSLAIIDSVFLWLSWTMGILGFVAYLFMGTFQLLRAPWNASINWLIILGLLSWWFLLLAPIAKLPFGLPLHAFRDTGRGLFYQHNYIYYGLLGTLWLIVFLHNFIPTMRDSSILVLGVLWSLLLGYLYVRKMKANLSASLSQ